MRLLYLLTLASLIVGCQSQPEPKDTTPKTRDTVIDNKIKVINLSSDEDEEDVAVTAKANRLYFQKTRGQRYYQYHTDVKKSETGWVDVKVKRSDTSGYMIYEVLQDVVSLNAYNGFGSKTTGVGNLTLSQANFYCKVKLDAELVSPYVMDSARSQKKLIKPQVPIRSEIIRGYDEDEDEVFAHSGDHVNVNEESDSSLIILHWDDESYESITNTFKSASTGFRCMKPKGKY